MNTTMKRHLAVALAATVSVFVWTGVASAADALTLCITAGKNVIATTPCKSNETEFKVVSAAAFNALNARVSTLEGQVSTLQGKVSALETLLAGVTRANDTLRFSGMNLQVVNGSGQTDNSENGLGNIIVGYNTDNGDTKTGSHNLVIGDDHTYTNSSGVVAGRNNTLTGDLSFVGGGVNNTASGFHAFVGGGDANTASGSTAFVGGGCCNAASGSRAFVGGGEANAASGFTAFVGGGGLNTASGSRAFVGGGFSNVASGSRAFVGGGFSNTATNPDCGIVFGTVFLGVC